MAPYKEYDFDPRHLPANYLEAIGLVTAASAQAENIVEMGIGGCLQIDVEYNAAVTTHMAAPLRDNVLRAVAEIKIDDLDDLDKLDQLLDNINAAFMKRNAYVHHCWCRDFVTGDVFTVKQEARGTVSTELIPMSIDQIKTDARFIYDASTALMRFLSDRDLLPPFPPGPRPRGHKSKAARKKRRKGRLG